MKEDEKRLFFGYEVISPWPSHYPKAKIIDPASRHLTLAFLGNTSYDKLKNFLNEFPIPPFKIGPVGAFQKCLFLPERNPRVVAWYLENYENKEDFVSYQRQVASWLAGHGYSIDNRAFLAHVTIGRQPEELKLWNEEFFSLPAMISGLHLYESKGNLVYQPLWSYPMLPAFEERDHTADIAFCVRGDSITSLHRHAQIALAFKYPPLMNYFGDIPLKTSLDEVIMALNQLISKADCDIGCPLKAVSFHGSILKKNEILTWEMIVDV